MSNFKDYRDYIGSKPEKFFKDTLFQGEHVMVGINCLEPGQVQPVHDHVDQDKVYVVMEGRGLFTVGEEIRAAGSGEIVWVAASVPHGVENQGEERLVLIVLIAPPPR